MTTQLSTHKAPLIIRETPIGEGAEGIVYEVVSPLSYQGYVVKLYKSAEIAKKRQQKIEYLIRNQPKLKNTYSVIFPEELVYDNGLFVGFLMKKAKGEFDLTSLCSLGNSDRLPLAWHEKFDRNTPQGIKNRLKLCYNIASAFHQIHATRYITFVDIKPENIKISLDGQISIVDIDSVAITDGFELLFPAEKLTQEYSPAEAKDIIHLHTAWFEETWDRFSLGVIFYKILLGLHPYTGTTGGGFEHLTSNEQKIVEGLFPLGTKKDYFSHIPEPHLKFKELPHKVEKLFLACFEAGNFQPEKRPSAEVWCKVLQNAQPRAYWTTGNYPIKAETKPQEKSKTITPFFRSNAGSISSVSGIVPALLIVIAFFAITFGSATYQKKLDKDYIQKKYGDYDKVAEKTENQIRTEFADKADFVDFFHNGVAWVLRGNLYGLIDQEGNELTPAKYDMAYQFSEGLAVVKSAGKYGYINLNGQEIAPIDYEYAEDFHDGMALVRLQGNYIFIDNTAAKIIDLHYDEIGGFKEGMAFFSKNGLCGYINFQGKEIIQAQFHKAFDFSEGLARIYHHGFYGYINNKGKVVIPCQYNTASNFKNGQASVENQNGTFYIDRQGKPTSESTR